MVVLRFHIHGRGDCMIERPLYLDKIMPFVDTPFVKILTGVRRCGKSTILKMIIKKSKKKRMWTMNRFLIIALILWNMKI